MIFRLNSYLVNQLCNEFTVIFLFYFQNAPQLQTAWTGLPVQPLIDKVAITV